MKILLLCGVFENENSEYIVAKAKRAVEYSANIFQEKLITGFKLNNVNLTVITAPFVGSFPNASEILKFKNQSQKTSDYRYVSFNNIWGIRNFSRAKAMKNEMEEFINASDEQKFIVVYSPHTPFLKAAVYAKAKDPRIKICLVVPDLPQYMNMDAHISLLYRIAKKYDIARFYNLNRKVDSYVLLTDEMKNKIFLNNRPYIVVEGIIDSENLISVKKEQNSIVNEDNLQYIVYTGKMNMKFGVKDLIDSFMAICGENLRLVLCGKGDMEEYICEKAKLDSRIMYVGQISPKEAKNWMYRARVLVNPRKNDQEYTKYSFPSKNIEYLMTGNPVVAYMLDGMPDVYSNFLCIVKDNNLIEAIENALTFPKQESFHTYAKYNLSNEVVAKKIINMMHND